MSISASLCFDRDPEFSMIFKTCDTNIIIKNPYIYNNNQWIENYHLIKNNKNCHMNFIDTILDINNNSFIITHKNIRYEIKSNKNDILDCFSVIINSKSIIRYEYWSNVRSII